MQKCLTITEVAKKSDVLVILSPDNSEHHLKYAKEALKLGKPCYINKTFAPDVKTAKKIFNVAAQFNSTVFSSSSLRFAEEIENFNGDAISVITIGPGDFETYSIHQIEMIVKIMGTGAEKVKMNLNTLSRSFLIRYHDGRTAVLNQVNNPLTPFAVGIEKDGKITYKNIESNYAKRLIDKILYLFDKNEPVVERNQTIEVISIIEAGLKSLSNVDKWIKIPKILFNNKG